MSHFNQAQNNSFNVDLAIKYGVECSIVLGHLAFWIGVNSRNKRNFRDGKTWTYQTRKEICAAMPYYSEDQVRRFTDRLCELGVLVKGNYNKSPIDKTIWYAFSDEEMFTKGESAIRGGESAIRGGKSARPIPDTNKNTNKENNNTPKAKKATPVVVFSCFDKLEMPQEAKISFSSKMDEAKAILLVDRVLAWTTRKGSHEKSCNSVLLSWKTWGDGEGERDIEKENQARLEEMKPEEGKKLGNYVCQVGNDYVLFIHPRIDGSKNRQFNTNSASFIAELDKFTNDNK